MDDLRRRVVVVSLASLAFLAGCAAPTTAPIADASPSCVIPCSAQTVVYVLDCTGSMTDYMMYAQYLLKQHIRDLKPSQRFTILRYTDRPPVGLGGLGRGQFIAADEAGRRAAEKFLEGCRPQGAGHPAEALRRAFALKPQVIYFVTDQDFDDTVVDLIDQLNAERRVTVHAIDYRGELDGGRMQVIADRNGGQYLQPMEICRELRSLCP